MFEKIIALVALGLSSIPSEIVVLVSQESPAIESKDVKTSEHMQRVLHEIEDFSSGVPVVAELSHHDQAGKKTESFVAPIIIFKESVAIFDIPSGAIVLVENINKSQKEPKIDSALVLFMSERGKKVVGEITEEDSTRLLQAITVKFEEYFREKPAAQEISLPTIA